jgi:hypothetical protein
MIKMVRLRFGLGVKCVNPAIQIGFWVMVWRVVGRRLKAAILVDMGCFCLPENKKALAETSQGF